MWKLFARTHFRGRLEKSYGTRSLPGSQHVDSQQEIDKVVIRLEFVGALQQRDGLGVGALFVELETSVQERFEFLV